MADGVQSGLSGVLFEAGKTISDAGKQQAQLTAQSVFSSVTGSQKQLFSKPHSGSAQSKPAGNQMPTLDNLGDFGKLFEVGKSASGSQQPQGIQGMSQQQIQTMAAQNQASDAQKIAQYEAELAQLKQQLHNENYYNAIKNAGKTMAQEREENAQRVQQEEAEKQQEQAQAGAMDSLSGDMFKGSAQLGAPVAVQQAKTQTEANRGTTG